MADAYEIALQRKQDALVLLSKLGFVDNEDSEEPGAVYHRETGLVIDCAKVSPAAVVKAAFDAGQEKGIQQIQADVRKVLGISLA
ncbi:hypothetical protein LJR296_008013 [Cupriavidus necator]|uniref:hypothetical protein n=1 Tax=Cupriavidus necator TaxID=106590 RepID=UPI003ED0AEA5